MTRRALDPDATAVGLDDALHDGQPEPRAATPGLPRLPEPIEHMRQVLGGNPDARVRHPEQDVVISSRRRPDRDAAAGLA